jgi:hypothetical protein
MLPKRAVICVRTPSNLEIQRRFGGKYHSFQILGVRHARGSIMHSLLGAYLFLATYFPEYFILKMEAIGSP